MRWSGLTVSAVLREHSAEIERLPGVTAVTEGWYAGGACINVYVDRSSPERRHRIPSILETFRVFVFESAD
jgi:hypothetical protein